MKFLGALRWLALLAAASCAEGLMASDDGGHAEGPDAALPVLDAAGAPDAAAPDACISSGPELCNGLDDDCDGDADEDFETGAACDSDDGDLCTDDVVQCNAAGDGVECVDLGGPRVEMCNGVDDDCDPTSADGADDPTVGAACDGPDGDLCVEGVATCSGGTVVCSDDTSTTADVCNGVDDDCDPASADGDEDPEVGPACDGPDGDLCAEGTRVCSGGEIVCSDVTSTTTDMCNGVDDDCDPASADGSEDPGVGLPCDGTDGDLCVEGVRSCTGGALVCSDGTGTTVDLCNGIDDDCDTASADGSEDPLVGVGCDGPDADLCPEGAGACVDGAVVCTDTTGDSVEVCNGADDDCDGDTDEGFPRDTDPVCSGAPLLGAVSGDIGPGVVTASEMDERWYRVSITENDFSSSAYLSATVQLDVPAGTDYDLYVYCVSCGGALAGQSTKPAGMTDTVYIRRNDGPGNESFEILVEVRFYSATTCANWTLTVTGDTAVTDENC